MRMTGILLNSNLKSQKLEYKDDSNRKQLQETLGQSKQEVKKSL
jgi:hypothetical protein